jgi:hypothetical protein
MKKPFLLITILLCLFNAYAQDSIYVNADKIFVNSYGSIYLISGASVTEIDITGKEQKKYTLSPPDIIDYCDVTNPLEILLFVRSGNRLCIIDSKFSPISDQYASFGEADVHLVCSSSRGGLWYFDAANRQLVHSDKTGSRLLKSIPLNGTPDYKNDLPVGMGETRDYILLAFPESGLMMFDRNGSFIRSVAFSGLSFMGMGRNDVYYGDHVHVICYNAVEDKKTELFFDISVVQIYSAGENRVVFDGKNIFFKKVKQ